MKLSKRVLRQIIREEKQKLQEGRMGEIWYQCMDNLFQMALENGYVCHLCASKAYEQCGQGPADIEICCRLIQDCCDDGMLAPLQHPTMRNVTVYTAID